MSIQSSKQLYVMILIFCLNIIVFANKTQLCLTNEPTREASGIVGLRDSNGDYCAAVKVVSEFDGLSYSSYNGVVKVEDKPGEDIVYLSPQERILKIYKSGYQPKKIVLSETGIKLNPQDIWKITVSGKKSVLISVEPKNATVYFDNKKVNHRNIYQTSLGKHSIKIKKEGYQTIKRTIKVNQNTDSLIFTLNRLNKKQSTISNQDTVDKGGVKPCLASCCISPRVGLEMNEGKEIRFSEWVGCLGNIFLNYYGVKPLWLYPSIKMGYKENGIKGCLASYFLGSRIGYELDERRVRTKEWLQLVPCINIYPMISIPLEAYRGETMSDIAKKEGLRKK